MIPALGLLVIRVRFGPGRRGLILPLPLFVAEEALAAVAVLVRLGLRLGWRPPPQVQRMWPVSGLADLVRLPAAFLRRLRAHGPFVLVDVTEGHTHVSVRIV